MSNAYKFYSGLQGANVITVGGEPSVYQFEPTELQDAIDACPEGGVVILEPRVYTLTASLEIFKPITLMSESSALGTTDTGAVITSALATPTVYVNIPATTTSAYTTNNFRNITFGNTNAGAVPGVEIDNDGGAAIPMHVFFQNCSFTSTGALALDIKQTTVALTTELQYLNFSECTFSGATALAHPLAGDEFNLYKCVISNPITMSAEAVASIVNIFNSIYTTATPTVGGDAAQLSHAFGNCYDAAAIGGAITGGSGADYTDLGFAAAGPAYLNLGLYKA